jgi:hypothetical protein
VRRPAAKIIGKLTQNIFVLHLVPAHLSRLLQCWKQTAACRLGNPLLHSNCAVPSKRRGKLTKLRQVIRFEYVLQKLIESGAGLQVKSPARCVAHHALILPLMAGTSE